MDIKTKLKFPKICWDKVLIVSAGLMGLTLLLSLVTRSRTIIRASQIIDVTIVLVLLALVFVSTVNHYSKTK